MTLRQYLFLMSVGTLLSWSAVALVVTMIDPTETQAVVFLVFYISLFLSLVGTFSVLGFVMRVILLKKHFFLSRQVAVSFRQALLLSSLIIVTLILQSKSLLNWWTALLVVAALTTLEFFFISAKIKR